MHRRFVFTPLAALALALTACGAPGGGAEPPPGGGDPPPAEAQGTYVGRIEGGDALIALVVEGGAVTAYTCGGEESWERLTGWFEGEIVDGAFEGAGGWQLALRGAFDGEAWSGVLEADGEAFAWTASAALPDRPAGLYRLDTDTREAGLIVDNDLTTAGVYYGKASSQTAPVRVTSRLEAGGGRPETLDVHAEVYGGRSFVLRRQVRPFRPSPPSPERMLRQAIARAFPDMEAYRLLRFDDREAVATLRELARASAADPARAAEPNHLVLPVVDEAGRVRDHTWTVYHHDVRADDPDFGLYVIDFEGGAKRIDEIAGPSLTFQGFPRLSDAAFQELATQIGRDPKRLADESRYQGSELSLIGGELSGTYYGDAVAYPSVIEGLRTLLGPRYGLDRVETLLRDTGYSYVVYNALHYQPETTHGYPHLHEHGATGSADLAPQGHFDDDPWKAELLVAPIADATIFDPEEQEWLVPDWMDRVESAVNRQNNVWQWLSMSLDDGGEVDEQSSLSVRTTIAGFSVLGDNWRDFLDPDVEDHYPPSGCGPSEDDDRSFIDVMRKALSEHFLEDNTYKMLWTDAYGGGCAYRGTLNGGDLSGSDAASYAVGWVGIRGATADWTKGTHVHESGHIVGGSHEIDNEGDDGETTHLQRCRLLGAIELGHEGPSILSYNRDEPRTLCFAYPTGSGAPEKNLSIVAGFLHQHLE